jgi:hypothetical protein
MVYRQIPSEKILTPLIETEHTVGGYFGYKTCPTRTEFQLNKNIVNPGEIVSMSTKCDNS